MNRVKSKVAILLVAILSLIGATAIGVQPAGATVSSAGSVPCYGASHPFAPNVVDYCVGWVGSNVSGFVYRVEMSHHVGWWGGAYDPGTWHVLIDRFYPNGTYIDHAVSLDVGDGLSFPMVWTSSYANLSMYPSAPANFVGHAAYQGCSGPYISASTSFSQLPGQIWPLGDLTTRYANPPACQIGFGFIAPWVTVHNNNSGAYTMGQLLLV